MQKVTEYAKTPLVYLQITFYLTQSHGLDSAYLKCERLPKQRTMSSEEYLVWKGWYSSMLRKNVVFYSHDILISNFATKTSTMRYGDNLSKDYNLLKSHFMWKAIFWSPAVDSVCGWCRVVQKKT